MKQGRFRGDLYYRLNVVSIRLPALRDREGDVSRLIRYFLHRYGKDHQIIPETMSKLLSYSWPGNVRELENCIKHMVAVNSGPLLKNDDLPSTILNYSLQAQMNAMNMAIRQETPDVIAPPMQPVKPFHHGQITPLAELEKREILRALEYTKGDRVAAANLLGIGRTTLYRKLKEYKTPQ